MTGAPGFGALFGRTPDARAAAPGRVNLIGEHTDYNGGFVLPTVIPQHCYVQVAARADDLVQAASAEAADPGEVQRFRLGDEQRGGGWLDYLQGLTWALRQATLPISGFDLWTRSEVPLGSGLSSSAAFEVSTLRALREAFRLPLDDVQLALLGQQAENDFVGARVGAMDQLSASLGVPGAALFLDTRTLVFEHVPLPPEVDLVVVKSGVTHALAGGSYNTRRAECEQAAALLGVAQLRDVSERDLSRVDALPEPLNRRARHVVTENARVLDAVAALRQGDVERLGALFYASHASQRDLFEVSVPAIDQLVELARQDPDVYGARLTGGGFGGSIVVLARPGRAATVGRRLTAADAHRSPHVATVLVPRPDAEPASKGAPGGK